MNGSSQSAEQPTQTFQITPESHPEIWQHLQPPAQPEQPAPQPTPCPEGWDKV